MCSSWIAAPLVIDMQYHDEIQPHHATLEVALGFGMASWQSPMSSFTFQCACAESQTRAFNLGSLSFTPKA